jgi:hypothetical protein
MSQVGFLVWPALAWNCEQYFRFPSAGPAMSAANCRANFIARFAHDCLSDQVELLFQRNCVDRLFLFLSLVANALGLELSFGEGGARSHLHGNLYLAAGADFRRDMARILAGVSCFRVPGALS